MKSLTNYINEKLIVNKNYNPYTYAPKSFDELGKIIEQRYEEYGPGTKQNPIDFNDIDVSNIDSFCNDKDTGIFDGMDIHFNAKEMQPKDIYLLDIFNRPGWKDERPDICKEVDPELPYCQVYGRYRLKLHGLGTITPYNNMFESCPSVPPLYVIPPGC